MIKSHFFTVFASLMMLINLQSTAQETFGFLATARQNYYTTEPQAQIILSTPEKFIDDDIMIDLVYGKDNILFHARIRSDRPVLVPINIDNFPQGDNIITTSFYVNEKWLTSFKVNIRILPHQRNAVKIDRLNGNLICEGLPFLPMGFYTYSPVQQGLPEAEKAHGFNMISPYNMLTRYSLDERKAFMDRMADIGMKVNYNLLWLTGEGGVGQKGRKQLNEEEKRSLLIREIETFKDHPALLSWYISDEPVGQGVSAEYLEKQYNLIKSVDPYHPVSIVFMAPHAASQYRDAMDIVMTDPYPIPANDPVQVAEITKNLQEEFHFEKAIWLVPQAFGGNEYWKREPSPKEIRLMSWYGLMNGARGLQYFIRSAHAAFPKSAQGWNAASQSVTEAQALLPFLISEELNPHAENLPKSIRNKVWKKGNELLIVCANTKNQPEDLKLKVQDLHYSGPVEVFGEQRKVMMQKGELRDKIGAYGVQIYIIRLTELNPPAVVGEMIRNGSFEDNNQPGVPEGCYVLAGSDLGSNYSIDTRRASDGKQSLMLTTATEGKGVRISTFPVEFEKGRSYQIQLDICLDSLQKPLPKKRNFWQRLFGSKPDTNMYILLGTTSSDLQKIPIKSGWSTYSMSTFIPENASSSRKNIVFELFSKGSIWVDNLRIEDGILIDSRLDGNKLIMEIKNIPEGEEIKYTLDGSDPAQNGKLYTEAVLLAQSGTIKAVSLKDNKITGRASHKVSVHKALGNPIHYLTPYSRKYNGGGKLALVDGQTGSADFKDPAWQGFMGSQITFTIDCEDIDTISNIQMGFLKNQLSWIFLPKQIIIEGSKNGDDFEEIWKSEESNPEQNSRKMKKSWSHKLQQPEHFKKLKIIVKTIGNCPDWHSGKGKAAWLFMDEVVAE